MGTDKGTSDGKRFGDEINYVKERSAERVFPQPGRRLLYNKKSLQYVHKKF
jgi:hypothetical protein